MSRTHAFLFLFLCLFFAFLGACGGSSAGVGDATSSTEPTASLAGVWNGTWLSPLGASGTLTITMRQSGSTLEGDLHFTGSPCFASGRFAGSVTGRDFRGSVTAGAIRVDMSGTVTGDAYDGTYTAVAAGACTGDTGTFTASR